MGLFSALFFVTFHLIFSGMQQRLPTVQELQFYADTIKQNVLIKRQLEEERERIRKQPEKVAPTHL